MSAGTAGAFNCYIDRVMRRAQGHLLVTGELTDRQALVLAWALGVTSIAWLWGFTNWLDAALSLKVILLYVVFYTMILKRRTAQNIVWGGVAGCMPVLIGWAAVIGDLAWPPFILFTVIFLWTPPHYWPLSMKYRSDYQTAGVPMLAVVRGRTQVGLQVILQAWATVACFLLIIPTANMGPVYTFTAVVTGGWFIYDTHRLYNRAIHHEHLSLMRVVHGLIAYLTLLFLAVAVDPCCPSDSSTILRRTDVTAGVDSGAPVPAKPGSIHFLGHARACARPQVVSPVSAVHTPRCPDPADDLSLASSILGAPRPSSRHRAKAARGRHSARRPVSLNSFGP